MPDRVWSGTALALSGSRGFQPPAGGRASRPGRLGLIKTAKAELVLVWGRGRRGTGQAAGARVE